MLSRKLAAPSARSESAAHDLARLRTLLPLRHLSDSEFQAIAAYAEVESLRPGQELFRAGRDDAWIFYVLDGAATVFDAGGDGFALQAGTLEALHPLSPHPKARCVASAQSALRFVRLPATLTQDRPLARAGIEVVEISEIDDDVDHRLLFQIYHALHEGRLVLPSLPDIAVRIFAAAEDERKGVAEIARIIQADPALAAYCVSVANSAAYAGGHSVAAIPDAVMRMGIAATRDFITAYSMRGMFNTRHPRCLALMQAAWRHSANIGALSHVIARKVSRQNPEQAMLAGLLHDIGVMVLIAELQNQHELLGAETTLRTLLRELKHQVTAMVLRAWRLPESFVRAAFAAEHWSREANPELDLADTLLLAHWHQEQSDLPWADPVPAHGAALLRRMPAEALTEEGRLQIVTEASEELTKLTALLAGG